MANRSDIRGDAITLVSATKTATVSAGGLLKGLGNYKSVVVTLSITAAERDTGNETYDFYVTSGDGVSSWDVIHFPQIASTGVKTYTAIVCGDVKAGTVTTAAPGVEAVMSATMKTDTVGAGEGVRTLTAGMVRHGAIGDRIGYELVVAGTVVTGIAFSITVVLKP